MNKVFKTMAVMLCMIAAVPVYAGDGSSCSNAIPLTKENEDFQYRVSSPKTVWFTAQTFDLPIKVCFTPDNPALPLPDVEMDFTCTPGVYDDPILCDLFCPSSSSGVSFDMPHKVNLTEEDGSYCISMGKKYRDLLLQTGISYNVEVHVKVVFKSAGTLSMIPDTEFSDCMDGGKFIKLGDTINIKANDTERYFVLPFVQWAEDSIRVIWTGTEPCVFAFASTCQFNTSGLKDDGKPDPNVLDRPTIHPNETLKYTAKEVKEYAEFENAQAGMYYGRVSSSADGVLKIERVPIAPPDGGATLLRYGKAATILANDINALYALHRDTFGLRFDCPTDHIVKMYIGTSAEFTPETAIASYQYDVTDDGHALMLKRSEIDALWTKTLKSYLYVRFLTGARTTVTPRIWKASECVEKWDRLRPGVLYVDRYNNGIVYHRFYYNEWKDGDMSLSWSGTQYCNVWIGDTCSFPNNTSNPHVVKGQKINSRGSYKFTADELAGFANRVDDEGNLYLFFYTSTAGNMTISTTATEEDPAYPAATIALVCENDKVFVKVSKAQSIVVKDALGAEKDAWEATPAEAHELTLPAGVYILKGKDEQIQITLP